MSEAWGLLVENGALRNFVALVVFLALVARTYARRIKPFMEAILKVDAAVPVLMSIATEFRPNGGASLHDRLVRIEANVDGTRSELADMRDTLENTESTVEAQDHMTIRLLVAMADGFRKLGHEIVVDLPPHAHGIAPTMTKPASAVPTIKENP